MTESPVETIQVTLTLPVLHPSQTPREAVAHLAHMFNDFGEDPPFEEIGKYGPKTTEAVKRIQKEHGLQTGSVGLGTWKALLEKWCRPKTKLLWAAKDEAVLSCAACCLR
jgi:murein L,D-transpeptidase YcbB/YkuD